MAAGMTWHSQAGQDKWVIEQMAAIPAKLIPGSAAFMGYFVDVGAHDGIVHSNTYALESEYGWTGVCVEPNGDVFDQLWMNRKCDRSRRAISDHEGTVQFDGIRVGVGTEIECWSLADLLEMREAPPVIDYLSIDVEGHELEVLAGMDFHRWKVRLITIEHNRYSDGTARKDAIYACLTGVGFERVVEDVVAPGYGEYEDWYSRT